MILEEARQLREMAGFYHHPEAPVATHFAAGSRCFFSRYSAPTSNPDDLEAEEERKLILADAKNLKELAEWYLHPENPVVSSHATASARNYFARPSAPEQEDEAIEEERERILEEMKQLKTTAEWYMHPEKPVAVDSTACGRDFFSRPSAPVMEEEEERERILEEMKQLKTTAEWYMHPEKPVAVDSTACGRDFFARPSAPEYQEEEMEEERAQILKEMKELKTIAEWYMHPEKPVAVDSAACGRNFFNRPSAFDDTAECVSWKVSSKEQHLSFDFESNYTEEMEEEREQIMEEMKLLKTTAEWYMHPEKQVSVDTTACGRNFFSRPSAPEQEEEDMEEERGRILEEMMELKTNAEWYLNPEKPVSVEGTACGRNFFSRPSALDDDAGAVSWEGGHLSLDFESNYTEEMEAERKQVLAEAKQLKEVAIWYLQPEKPIAVDSTLFGRNYFSRVSAPEQEDVDDIEERELILAEVNELKKVADWYRNPEKEVTVYSTACGRNYFNRPSAPIEDDVDAEEREVILADAAELLRVAKWYMHPEKPVTVYATAGGRNFFSRPSAPPVDVEMEEERLRILADAKQLKEVAGWYANPNQPVKSDGFSSGRNYFTRPSAPEYEEDTEEREQVLTEAKELKEVASWYSNPEQPVKSDGFATARNYFTRPSAPEQEIDVEERNQIVAEAEELKEVASWYLQREKPVARSSVNCVRNFFDRASAAGHADHIHSEGYADESGGIHSDYVHQGFDFQYAEYDHHDQDHHQHHDCDVSQQSFHSHLDHFDMDEDLSGFRDSINAFRDSVVGTHDPQHIPIIKEEDDGKEGNLSRSPSSIMLFDEQPAAVN